MTVIINTTQTAASEPIHSYSREKDKDEGKLKKKKFIEECFVILYTKNEYKYFLRQTQMHVVLFNVIFLFQCLVIPQKGLH